jgi:hypothetical protein
VPDPIRDIEDKKAQLDLGVMGFRVFQGAINEGARFEDAIGIVSAYFYGLFKSAQESNKEDAADEDAIN